MKTKTFLLLVLATFYFYPLLSQSSFGTLSGQVIDSATGQAVEYANVVIFQNGNQITGRSTDDEGYFSITPLQPGIYDVGATHLSYKQFKLSEVVINASLNKLNIPLVKGDYTLPPTEIITFKKVLIDPIIGGGIVLTGSELKQIPVEKFSDVVSLTPGVYDGSFQGNRAESSVYIVDGMKIRGDLGVHMSTVQEMRVLTGGIPAEYGDLLGGVVIIETKNPLNQLYSYENNKCKSKKRN